MKNEPLEPSSVSFLRGGGEMGALMRSYNWAKTPLGQTNQWTQSLRSALSICLNSRFPIAIYWGKDCILLYNDAWRPIVGNKHPWALGRPAQEVWSEIWDNIGPELAGVLATGEGTFHKDDLLSMYRYGYVEECFFEYTFNPIQGQDGTVDGVFNVVSETTERVLSARRARLLREVASKTGIAKTVEAACTLILETIKFDPLDLPFALLYQIDPEGKQARLCTDSQCALNGSISPAVIDLTTKDIHDSWAIARAARTAQPQEIDNLVSRFGIISGSPWAEPPQEAIVLPICAPGSSKLSGVLVAVASPRRRLDENYRNFFSQVAAQIALLIANAQAYEEERKRAEVLAEIDRAKTVFFSNVSHEFRTPLTLMLAPTEDALTDLEDPLSDNQRSRIETVHRNGVRLLKLVNTLLDFSRIEAGRVQANYAPTDLATFTAELASVFRSAIERAGMRLVIDCLPLPEDLYVDREMWEKILFNLLSNAFKFTFAGEILVSLEWQGDRVVLRVKDTGIGIPASDLPHLFERFHRVEGAQGRSIEGSGIGLSLVQELVKLHQGTIAVTSVEGAGTCFTVCIPTGIAHLPAERINASRTLASTALGANSYLEEALRWLPENGAEISAPHSLLTPDLSIQASAPHTAIPQTARILLADDNADMRDYVKRLLSQQYEVEAVSDGVAALSAVLQQVPDLILTDVMMPNLDGFGLLQALRTHTQTREIPIILLSARAGEEARIEGLTAGADDYLIKPFSARELLARVEAALKLAQLRREAMQKEQALRREAEAAREEAETANRIKDEFLAVLSHELRSPLNPILGWSKLLQSGRLSEAKASEAIATIERNAKLQSDLIEDLLDISRILRGKLTLTVSPVNLGTTIQAALETVHLAAKAKSIELITDLNSVGYVSGDPTRLQQVVWNLLSNAVKFTPPEGRVTVRLEQTQHEALMTVRDTGKGIHPNFLPYIFDHFRQEDGATTRKFGGLGLGLAIARQIVELHGGSIGVNSSGEGQGATFSVRLPLIPLQPALDSDKDSSSESMLDLSEVRILLIDDETDSREFIAFVLEQAGAQVTTAVNAAEGFERFEQSQPDILLSDIGMPDMDGYMLMRKIRALPLQQGKKTPAIALTAYAGDSDRQQALEAGFQHHLSKPIEAEQLIEAIAHQLHIKNS